MTGLAFDDPARRPSSGAADVFLLLEKAIIVVLLCMYSEGLLSRLFATEENPEGGVVLRTLWLPTYLFVLIGCLALWRKLVTIAIRAPALVLLVLLVMASSTWSITQDVTFRRGIAIAFTTGFGLYLAARYSWTDMLRLLGFAWIVLAIGSFIAALVTPSFGIMSEIHVGAWRGLWWEKNTLGGHMARASFLFAFLILFDPKLRKLWWGAFAMTVALVLLSTSKTALLGLLLGCTLLLLVFWMKRGPVSAMMLVWSGTAAVTGLAFVVFTAPDVLVGILGRDLTLTGRTDIWAELIRAIQERPLFGYGYGVFWLDEMGPAYWVRQGTEWEVPTAHNGLLEVALSIGLVGVGVFLVDFLMTLTRAAVQAFNHPSGLYGLGFLVLYALFSISESVILQQNNINWVIYAAISAKLALDSAGQMETSRQRTEFQKPRKMPPKLRGRHTAARP